MPRASLYARRALKIHRTSLDLHTNGRATYDVTARVQEAVKASGITEGICHLFIHHTSASLLISENADPTVRTDLERFLKRLVPDGDPIFRHTAEGDDDMPAHVRTMLTETTLALPVDRNRCDLGTWQGVYIWEHRNSPHTRRVTITVMGEG